ncbi:LytTR family transcriptional regulator DNA-binding domain-containing protein [Flavivirga spongiicola]|uniref:LytTR family transcriptional regulator n=1 Tax=Flavivirga spongiicola TaxID=421621 RepID=A0ABU7XQR7_9FLAO|nr:LytTR family transcriptional regulator DNA-binding domain-containing protein [Flavivirga sp. MEBiC05379]MDO5978129.1 LytTR family transcriptional regulator DNA-binding domain-containing protein [Flavivirga sp. MEBiC05379]
MKFTINRIVAFLKKEAIIGELAHNTRKVFLMIIGIVFCLLFFFKPFSINLLLIKTQLIITIGSSILAGVGYVLAISIFMPFNKKKWTVFLEISTVMTTLFFVWLLIYVFLILCSKVNLPVPFHINEPFVPPENFFFKTLIYTLGTGTLVYIILHMYNVIKFNNGGNKIENNTYTGFINKNNLNKKTLNLIGKNKDENLVINSDCFICAKSEGHYIKVYYLCGKSKRFNSSILRNTMKNIDNQTVDFENIYRCHNSYFLNLDFLTSVIGNSNKAHAYLKHYSPKVPISKNKIEYLKEIVFNNKLNKNS